LESKLTLQSGQIKETQSPCGSNCSFTTTFIGPYLFCNATNFTQLVSSKSDTYLRGSFSDLYIDYYSGVWDTPLDELGGDGVGSVWFTNETVLMPNISINISRPAGLIYSTSSSFADNASLIVETQQFFCVPGRAAYNLNTTYVDGARKLSLSTEYLGSLLDICQQEECVVNQTDAKFQALSLFSIVDSMFTPLSGKIACQVSGALNTSSNNYLDSLNLANYTFSNGSSVQIVPVNYNFGYFQTDSSLNLTSGTVLCLLLPSSTRIWFPKLTIYFSNEQHNHLGNSIQHRP